MIKELYKIDNKGKVRVWKAWVEGADVIVEHGTQGGKMQESRYTAEVKNVGRSNETTRFEQAQIELTALYIDQQDNNHYRDSVEGAVAVKSANRIPRKILNYKDGWEKLPDRCITSIKLNGSRACIIVGQLYSKIGRPETIKIDLLRKGVERLHELGLADVDCEVYAHGIPLQRIRSAWLKPVKTDKEVCAVANKLFNLKGKARITIPTIAISKLGYDPNQDAQKLKFHIFDIPMSDGTVYEQRLLKLEEVWAAIQSDVLLQNCFDVCEWFYTDSHEERMNKLDVVAALDYEGLVHYDPDGVYEFGKRSINTQKAKLRPSAEALVLSCRSDKSGQGVLELQTTADMGSVTFNAKMKGDAASRSYEAQLQFVGKWVTYNYEELSSSFKPTKPTVQETRLCDTSGNPLE